MRTRLVVGCGPLGRTMLEALSERRGRTVALRADPPEDLAERWPAIEIVEGDPTDVGTLHTFDDVETVVVGGEDPDRNLASAKAAREAFPDAFLLSFTGADASDQVRTALATVSDRLVDPATAVRTYLTDRLKTGETSMHELRGVLSKVDGELAVVMHDNPDPDAIASAVAFQQIAERMNCPATACYYGSINHQENRAMVNLLDYDLCSLEPDADLSAYGGFALVDHARPGINDGLPTDTAVDVVIDHHPPRGPVAARFTDLRSHAGATSTLLVDYFQRLGLQISTEVATGLLLGIRVDTDEFSREVSVADFEAGAALIGQADLGMLERIENPSMSSDTLETIAEAIISRRRHGATLLSGVGQINDRDTLAQAADRLLNLNEVRTTLVYGVKDGTIYISARSRGTELDLGEALRAAFGQVGSAGGHADMAGAQIELGLLESIDAGEQSLREILDEMITDRFLDVLDIHPSEISRGTYGKGGEASVNMPESDSWQAESVGTIPPDDDAHSQFDEKTRIDEESRSAEDG